MKFDLSGEAGRAVNVERHSLSTVVHDMATREGYVGDAFRDRYHLLAEALGSLTKPAPTPEGRAALRDFAAQIIAANQEPAADPVAGQATLPTSGEGAAGFFDSAKFRGGDGDGQ